MRSPPLPEGGVEVDRDACWWRNRGRQTREHLFKEYREWKKEIHVLWQKGGSLSGERKEGSKDPLKSRRGLGYVRKACMRSSNVTVGDLLGNEIFAEAVLGFLGI